MVDYALDGQFVSNARGLNTSVCIGSRTLEPSTTTFLRPKVELISPYLLVPYYAMIAISFVAYGLVMFSANKFIDGEVVIDHQSVPFLCGFLVCTFLFGVAITAVEIPYFPRDCFVSPHNIPGIVCLIAIFVTVLLLLIATRCWAGCRRHTCTVHGCCSCYGCFKTIVPPLVTFISTFMFVWLIICLFPTLLLGFAYPLKVLSLVVLHVAFVFVFTVALAVGLTDLIFWWNAYYVNRATFYQKKGKCEQIACAFVCVLWNRIHNVFVLLCVVVVGCLAYVGFMIGYGVTVVQGFVTSDGASAVVSLFPSLVMFIIGWLVKRSLWP